MKIETKSSHITPAGGNVFADLGFDPDEAKRLKAESQAIIARKIAVKEQLMAEIVVWMNANQLKQVEAAKILGITRPRVSDVVHKKSFKFTVDSLIDMVARIGKAVSVHVA
jgi:predicted XRE-type DNA-binding protein